MANKLERLLLSLAMVGLTAAASAWLVQDGIKGWYQPLPKPTYTPPSEWFRIIWGILYVLMAVSYYLILGLKGNPVFPKASRLFVCQLFLQAVWSFVFFRMGYPGPALAVILLLDYIVYKMIAAFLKISPAAARLQYPFMLWLLYASCLNFSFVYMNGFIVGF